MQDVDLDPAGIGGGVSRRTVLSGTAAASLTALGGGQMAKAEQSEKTALEIENETLVNNFCRDWALRDVEALRPYLAEDLLYQITPGQPLIESRDQFEKQMGRWLKGLESVHWDILRSHVIGPVVLNERIDHFDAPEGGSGPSMRFHIVGHFFIADGVIQVWKDWPMPGAKQFIG